MMGENQKIFLECLRDGIYDIDGMVERGMSRARVHGTAYGFKAKGIVVSDKGGEYRLADGMDINELLSGQTVKRAALSPVDRLDALATEFLTLVDDIRPFMISAGEKEELEAYQKIKELTGLNKGKRG